MPGRPSIHNAARSIVVTVLSCIAASAAPAASPAAPPTRIDAQTGAARAPGIELPFSAYASPEALQRWRGMQVEHATPPGESIAERRAYYDRINRDRVERMKRLYPVRLSEQRIGGVLTDVAEPAQGIATRNAKRVLINLHGGAFLWGARSGALAEAIPIASVGAIRVVSVDYRQGPEHVFPAASEDVQAVYEALLKDHLPQDIGIYGCSAGGALTGQVVARLISKQRPLPGAIGTFCASVTPMDGDSLYVAPLLNGEAMPTRPPQAADYPYLTGASAADPLVFPALSSAILAKFPPTLLITGSRDFAMSSVLRSQRLLDAQGVETELQVWDGMWHAFFVDPELPESKQAYDVIVRFFDRHLGRAAAAHSEVGSG